MPLHTPGLLINVGYKGVYITRTCFPDVMFLVCDRAGVCQHYQIQYLDVGKMYEKNYCAWLLSQFDFGTYLFRATVYGYQLIVTN